MIQRLIQLPARCCLLSITLALLATVAGSQPTPGSTSESQASLVEGSLTSEVVPAPVEYYALLPPDYEGSSDRLPLVLNLHGGGGSREVLKRQQPMFEGCGRGAICRRW